MPPTERRGRVHTSTVTVAVLDPEIQASNIYAMRSDDDFRIEWFAGTGKGGQHKNKHQNSCRVHHIPTGMCEARQGRERATNLKSAKEALMNLLDAATAREGGEIANIARSAQVGSGMRGDKRRTYRFQDERVTDHITGKTTTCREAMKGELDILWE